MPTGVSTGCPGTPANCHAVTGVGFQPNLVLHAHAGYQFTGALGTNRAGAHFGLGAMDGDGNQWAVTQFAVDNNGAGDTQRGQQTNGTIYSFNNAWTPQKKASFVSMDMSVPGDVGLSCNCSCCHSAPQHSRLLPQALCCAGNAKTIESARSQWSGPARICDPCAARQQRGRRRDRFATAVPQRPENGHRAFVGRALWAINV